MFFIAETTFFKKRTKSAPIHVQEWRFEPAKRELISKSAPAFASAPAKKNVAIPQKTALKPRATSSSPSSTKTATKTPAPVVKPSQVASKEAAPKESAPSIDRKKALASLQKALQNDQPIAALDNGSASSSKSEAALRAIDEDLYREELRALLEKRLQLPIKEKKRLSLTLRRDGRVKRCDAKKCSLKNQRYLEEKLFSLQFRAFGSLFLGEPEHTFIVELEYD